GAFTGSRCTPGHGNGALPSQDPLHHMMGRHPSYLHTLVQAVPSAANSAHYAEIVHERAVLRRLVAAGTKITQMGFAAEGELEEIVNAAQAEVFQVDEERGQQSTTPFSFGLDETIGKMESLGKDNTSLNGTPTGLQDLDSLTRGLQPGQLIVIAARPAMGKSTLALDIARACSIQAGTPAVFFSLEMGREELHMRTLSAEAKVALHHMRSGTMTDDDWTRLARRMPDVQAAPLFLDVEPNMTMMDLRVKCRRMKQQHPNLGLVVVDYLQLMQSGGARRHENRQQEVSDMSRNLKLLAKELEVPIVALSQLNRGPEQREDKKPRVSDLRESGSIEQDADMVILLHREDAYDKESPRAGEADLIVAKHRNGPTATITVAFQGHYSRFVDMAAS
ncbi:replicative DNA helicase, partial [Streptomyces lavendulae]|uniref:replicative DNA helicase n=1 Tax=Streptomyces lavendulae TaxID=1914 RepID=UPI0033F2E403